MTCCETLTNPHKKHLCPVDGNLYPFVTTKTIKHQLKTPWLWDDNNQPYFYCDNNNCDVVYFSADGDLILNKDMKIETPLLCYCFGISQKDYVNSPSLKQFVVSQTKQKLCACDTANPSGKCCLKHFS